MTRNIYTVMCVFAYTLEFARAEDVSKLLAELGDRSATVRMSAFYLLRDAARFPGDQETKLELIQLLGREIEYSKVLSSEDDKWAAYYGEVVRVVASLQDERAIPNLLNVIQTGKMVTNALAAFGSAALDGVVSKLGSNDPTVTTGAALTISRMLDPDNFPKVSDSASQSKIQAALIRAASSRSPFTANVATLALSKLSAVLGDVNRDGVVDCKDLAIVRAALGTKSGQPGWNEQADVVKDGVIDVRDVAFVSQRLPAGTRCP